MKTGLIGRILAFVERQRMLRVGNRVGVAVSGGADSVALLLLLLELRKELGIVLSVVHLNHLLRGADSDHDEKFVAGLAAKYELAFHVEHIPVREVAKREKWNLEDAARRLRYAFFERLLREEKLSHIATAHTADDQAETVLAHIFRGTGLAGLGGIHPITQQIAGSHRSHQGNIIRPLLEVRRKELRTFLKAKKQRWREDKTNQDTSRTRARIRKNLIPLLEKQFQPAIVDHLAKLAELAREDEAFLGFLASARLQKISVKSNGRNSLPIRKLFAPWLEQSASSNDRVSVSLELRERPIAKRLLRRFLESAKPLEGQISSKHIEAVLELALRGENGKLLPLPGGVEVRRTRDALELALSYSHRQPPLSPRKAETFEYQHNIDLSQKGVSVPVPQLGCAFRFKVIDWPSKREETKKLEAVILDRDRLRVPVILRNWRPGDRFQPPGRHSSHKMKRLLNEKRISRWDRRGWPVLISGGVLAWARGFPPAAEFAANERTQTGIAIEEEAIHEWPQGGPGESATDSGVFRRTNRSPGRGNR